jgi:hypothetical protein
MSRGHGWVQKKLLRVLRDCERSRVVYETEEPGRIAGIGLSTAMLTKMIYADGRSSPTQAQTVAVRRALRGLVRDGLIIGPRRLGDFYPEVVRDMPEVGRERFWRFNVAQPVRSSAPAGCCDCGCEARSVRFAE